MPEKLILVTGATGYIAGRLIPRLLERGYRVRCLARRPRRLEGRAWFRHVEVFPGDVTDPSSLAPALENVWSAYYLIHSMTKGRGYTALEVNGARNFAEAAESAGVEHIVYLGGLADPRAKIAAHMRSRIETGETLRRGRVPVTEFRAGVILGPGSISFEMIRFMTELMPVVIGPVWLKNRSQPIAAQNVFDYLLAALENPNARGGIFEIGGEDVMPYEHLMLEYARLRRLKRKIFELPYIPLWFMALGVGWMTPVGKRIARALIDGLRSDSIVQDDRARKIFANVKLVDYRDAIIESLSQLHPSCIEPVWADDTRASLSLKHEGFFIDYRGRYVHAAPEKIFQVVASLGQNHDWLYANGLWKLRGWFDQLLSARKRGATKTLDNFIVKPNDRLDFYRVERVEPNRLLLHSELKAPGEGWMEWRVEPRENGARLEQTAYFAPRGLPGFLYWHLLYPFHTFVFRGLIRAIARKAEVP